MLLFGTTSANGAGVSVLLHEVRMSSRITASLVAAGVLLAGCQNTYDSTGSLPTVSAPTNLTYQLDPSGDPSTPAGILLRWDDVTDASLASYRIYSRGSTNTAFSLRGETTSNTFHDNGVPHVQYYVTATDVNGGESDASNTVTVDERLALQSPDSLNSISLNGAIQLDWSDNAFLADPNRFQ